MSFSSIEYLRHMLDETDYLTEHSQTLSKEQFMGDETLKRAFVRSVEIIGEAEEPAQRFQGGAPAYRVAIDDGHARSASTRLLRCRS